MKFKILGLVIFLLFFLKSPLTVFAESEFSTSYDVVYDVGLDGITEVTEKITLKNLTSRYYASNFILTIGSTTVTGVSASDEAGAMEIKVEQEDGQEGEANKTKITVKFNQQITGIDKSQIFTLKFKSKDFAQNIGQTWEVNLSKIPQAGSITSYNLILSVPVSFGDPTSIAPTPASESQTFDRLFFTFNKDQLIDSGISVNFGTNQVFDFVLKYNLKNNALFPVITSITLPPDTRYQDILVNRISPEPLNVTVDEDGNYLAWYQLAGRTEENVVISGSAKLYINPKTKQFADLSQKQEEDLTKTDQYWEKDNPAILATLAEVFKDGKPHDNYNKVKLIYRYVVDHLRYDTSRLKDNNIERLGAVTALNNPDSAVCMEFTDLFIALCRAAGVPARELDGFAYSQNSKLRPLSLSKDLLHAWPEYFDKNKGWVMVDPTWENSSGGVDYFNKFDLNHVVFAVKGTSSKTPYVSDNVKVDVSSTNFLGKSQIGVDIEVPQPLWSGLPASLTVKVKNQGNVLQGPTILNLNSSQIRVLGTEIINLGPIPPFGSTTYKFDLRTPFSWQESVDNLEVSVDGQKFSQKVIVKPLFMFIPLPYAPLGLGALVLGIYGAILGLHIYKKRSS